jgi:hypothetical protein
MPDPTLMLRDRVLARVTFGNSIFTIPGTVVGRTIEAAPLYDVLLDGSTEIVNRMPRQLLLAQETSNNGR